MTFTDAFHPDKLNVVLTPQRTVSCRLVQPFMRPCRLNRSGRGVSRFLQNQLCQRERIKFFQQGQFQLDTLWWAMPYPPLRWHEYLLRMPPGSFLGRCFRPVPPGGGPVADRAYVGQVLSFTCPGWTRGDHFEGGLGLPC